MYMEKTGTDTTMFVNSRTQQRQATLRGYRTESEDEAKMRLQAAGWIFQGVDYDWDDEAKTFVVNETKAAEGKPADLGGDSDD